MIVNIKNSSSLVRGHHQPRIFYVYQHFAFYKDAKPKANHKQNDGLGEWVTRWQMLFAMFCRTAEKYFSFANTGSRFLDYGITFYYWRSLFFNLFTTLSEVKPHGKQKWLIVTIRFIVCAKNIYWCVWIIFNGAVEIISPIVIVKGSSMQHVSK